jgi:hypothetical protein
MPTKASGWSKAAFKEDGEEPDGVSVILAACKLMKGVGELF